MVNRDNSVSMSVKKGQGLIPGHLKPHVKEGKQVEHMYACTHCNKVMKGSSSTIKYHLTRTTSCPANLIVDDLTVGEGTLQLFTTHSNTTLLLPPVPHVLLPRLTAQTVCKATRHSLLTGWIPQLEVCRDMWTRL